MNIIWDDTVKAGTGCQGTRALCVCFPTGCRGKIGYHWGAHLVRLERAGKDLTIKYI